MIQQAAPAAAAPVAKAPKVKASKPKGKKTATTRFVLDCTVLVDDELLDTNVFQQFLNERIKINGKAGQLANSIKVKADTNKVTIDAEIPVAKRYLKYLAKKFLKKSGIRDYVRVIASSKDKGTYELRYLDVDKQEEATD